MRTRTYLAVALLVFIGAIVLWLQYSPAERNGVDRQKYSDQNLTAKASPVDGAKDSTGSTQTPSQPRLFKSTRYPPVTVEEKAMWDWWHAMEKTDPKFEWKMPIEFYGRVVDQTGMPVAAAVVHYAWTTAIGSKPDQEATTSSGADGNFAISGIRGKRLVVDVSKEGYVRTTESVGSYEYAAFHDELFHVPDKAHPVIFRLQKLVEAEPLLKFDADTRISLGSHIFLNVETGKFGGIGDLEITVGSSGDLSPNGSGYYATIRAVPGAGIVFSDDEFMFMAPEAGYRETVQLKRSAAEALTHSTAKGRFYVKTVSGKHAAVELETILWERRNEATLNALITHNPSGSRNLEFDQRKQLKR